MFGIIRVLIFIACVINNFTGPALHFPESSPFSFHFISLL